MVAWYAKAADVPPATGRRRVSLVLPLARRNAAAIPDAYWKSVLDALVHAELLIDDNKEGVELGGVEYVRGSAKATAILLEDLQPSPQKERRKPLRAKPERPP